MRYMQYSILYVMDDRVHYLAIQESLKCCLMSINVRIVCGWRLPCCSEMVLRPPENMCSTETAEPGEEGISVKVK